MTDSETLKALYKTLKATQKRLHEVENAGREPLAIIGMGCRFPGGASTLARYRALLERGGEGIVEVPGERWDGQAYYDPDPEAPGKVTTNRAGFLREPVDGFDCAFFHLSPKEVASIDPQQRLLLEVCWEAFENAGIDLATLKGSKTGVFCGIANSDYGVAHLRSGDPGKIDGYSVTGSALSAAVGRISYLFGFEGPNMALDTACSSSLVAVHLAAQSLRSGESDLAVAAGINLILTPEGHIGFSKLRALSPDGRCKSFDDAADGYGRGEGCGLVILKRLSDAERDGDPIVAVLRGTAVNQDGRTNGFTAPSSIAQEKVLLQALENSGLPASELGYIEAHGTGTPLGDPIEMAAIGKVYGSPARAGNPIYVGSVKANIGHLEAAAGIAGLIKAALILAGGKIFPQANFQQPSRHIPWEELAVRIPRVLTAWPEGARAAAVSSFGFSGTNAHAILGQRPALADRVRGEERSHHLLTLSARNGEGLRALAARYRDYLAGTEEEVGDICHTAAVGRSHFSWRLPVVGTGKEELRQALAEFLAEDNSVAKAVPESREPGGRRIVFLFTGQGSQYHQMGADLYASQPLFREWIDRCDRLLLPLLDISLAALLYGEEDESARLQQTRYTQPAIFAVEYSLAKLLESWGIRPSLVIGHSIGEYVAACVAGIFTLEEAIPLVAARGRLMQSLPANGAMAVVGAGEERLRAAVAPYQGAVALAAVNGPKNTVISGEQGAIAELCAALAQEGLSSHRLPVSHAFHSALLDPVLAEFKSLAAAVHYARPQLPLMANLSGAPGGDEMAGPDYWVSQMRQPVRFYDCMRAAGAEGYEIFIEVGGTSTLTNLGRQCLPSHPALWLTTLGRRDAHANLKPGRVEGGSDWQPLLHCLAGLYRQGVELDWQGFDRPYSRRKVVLPNYPFQRQRQWLDLPGPRGKVATLDAATAAAIYGKLNRLSGFSLLRVFKEGGVFLAAGERYRGQELVEKMGVTPEYHRLCAVLLIILAKEGFVALAGDEVTSLAPVEQWGVPELGVELAALQEEIGREYPGVAPVAVSFARCMDHYLAVITGRMSYVELLFPQGSMELINNLYSNNEIQGAFNRLLAQEVREWAGARGASSPAEPLRILELGAGMGSATARILPALSGLGNFTYGYTDIASAFIQHGREQFAAAYPGMEFKILNIEEELAGHGFISGSWDLVIASNVLHATSRIDHTLGQVRSLLRPGGGLIINEVTQFQEIVCVIFGLSHGWWLFADPECRLANGPSLSLDNWKESLARTGFVYEKQVGLAGDSVSDPMQCVILAINEGGGEMKVEVNGGAGAGGSPSGRRGVREEILPEVGKLIYQAAEIEIAAADFDRNLFELGFASLMIARLKDLLKRSYGVDLPMSWFFSRTDTFNKIVDYIAAECGPREEAPPPPARERVAPSGGGANEAVWLQLEAMSRQLQLLAAQLGPRPEAETGPAPPAAERLAAKALAAPASAAQAEYVAYRGITGREKLELNLRQKEHLQQLIGRYTGLTAGSKERTRAYRPVFANTRNIAGFRPEWKEMIYQIVVDRAQGSHFTDIDGRDYLDVTMGFGVYLFGHNPPFVQAALQRELRQGTPIGPMSDRAGKVATLIHELTGVERVAFFNTGTEAVMAAVRIARTVTGRKKVVLFSSSYHGHFDGVLAVKDYDGPQGRAVPMSPGTLPEMIQDIYVLDYGSEEALQFIERHGRELAAVLVEPVQSRRPELQPAAFLKQLREITAASGAALIFDEMIVGFRVHPGGGQAWFGIQADIVTYGKVVGGGIPIGVVAGKARYLDAVDGGMWNYGDGSFPERENTFIAGTFNHHPLAMAGAYEVLNHLQQSGPALQEGLNRRTEMLAARLNSYFAGERLPLKMTHFGSLFRIPLKGDQELLYYHLLSRGIYIWEGRNCFLSTAHTDGDLDYLVDSIQESIAEMRAGGLFPAPPSPGASGRREESRFFLLSSAQLRLYALSQMEGGELSYHTPLAFFLEGEVDRVVIARHFQTLIGRHESLRTGFAFQDDEVQQWTEEGGDFDLDYREVAEEELAAVTEAFIRSFDLARPPLFRVCLARISARRHFVLLDTHHLVFDGISGDLLIGELLKLLNGQALPPVKARYRDYVAREQAYLGSAEFAAHEEFWLGELSPAPPLLRLPLDYPRPERHAFAGDRLFLTIGREETAALKQGAARSGASLFMTLFAAHFLWLYKLTGEEDITVGTTYDARKEEAFGNVAGMFVNTIPVRGRPRGEKSFRSFLDEVKMKVLEVFDRQDYPFEKIVEKLHPQREPGRNPLFDTMFVFEPVETESAASGAFTLAKYDIRNKTAMFDLSLEILELDGTLTLSLEYRTALFTRETCQRYLGYYERILGQIAAHPEIRLQEVELLSARERKRILEEFNDSSAAYPEERSIGELFAAQVGRTPERVAVVCGSVSLTYRELNQRANAVGCYLRNHWGIKADDIVGVMVERSEWMIVAVLGILKAGGAWLPLDPGYPPARIRFILADSGSRVVVSEEKFLAGLGDLPAGVAAVDIREMAGAPGEELAPLSGPRDLAYVIYTSGSTGTPKGVMIEHRSLVNNLWGTKNYLPPAGPWQVGFTASFLFDPSVQQICASLLHGHCLHVIPEEILADGLALIAYIHGQKIDLIDCTPTLFALLVREGLLRQGDLALSQVLLGGEVLPRALCERVELERLQGGRPLELFNLYGPAECCVDVTSYPVSGASGGEAGCVPAGRPKANMRLYILGPGLRPVPLGVEGEIWISGPGLARGYLGQAALTAEKFREHPFLPGERIYRSGDLGRWRADGNLEYGRRRDEQVKIRGYRIECGEIEHRLLAHSSVSEAAVAAREEGEAGVVLTAYLVVSGEVNPRALRSFLRESLPEYMVPARFVTLAKLPVTANGKVDRKALALTVTAELASGTPYVAPRSALERLLGGIWEKVLGRAPIGIDDGFFELGGDSIKAIQTLSRLSRENLRHEIRELFATPTIRELAPKLLPKLRRAEQGAISGPVPLTAIQLWHFRTNREHLAHYTQALLLRAREGLEGKALAAAVAALLAHHDALRMSYRVDGEELIQENKGAEGYPLCLETIDLRGKKNFGEELASYCQKVPAAISLEGPLLRALHFLGDGFDQVCLVIHHLVVDGVSWRILLEDLERGYEQALAGRSICLEAKSDSFQLWGERLREYCTSPRLLAELPYWQALEARGTERIPTGLGSGGNCYREMATVTRALSEEETAALTARANRAYHTETRDLLLAALARTIKRRYGGKQTLIDLEGHGREAILGDLDTGRTVGWFTTISPFVLELGEEETGGQIKGIKEELRRIPDKGIGYGILQYLTPPEARKELSFALAPQILFNYLGEFAAPGGGVFTLEGKGVANTIDGGMAQEHELELEGAVVGGRLGLTLAYNTQSFAREEADAFLESYREELQAVIGHCLGQKQPEFTPHDLSYKGLAVGELEALLAGSGVAAENLKDIYPLSPLQEGMLYQDQIDSGLSAAVQQIAYRLEGEFDLQAFAAGWNSLIGRHDILRTIFVHKGLERPLQVVAREGRVDLRFADISGRSPEEQQAYLARYLKQDSGERFDLAREVAMRVGVIKCSPSRHEIVWSTHHIILDGWCNGILMSELFAAYSLLRAGEKPPAQPAPSYSRYIRWLEGRDRPGAIAYWRQRLAGYERPAGIPKGVAGGQPFVAEMALLTIGRATTGRLKQLAAANRVTLNTLLQTVWGVLLGRYNGVDDVVFGAIVSGRPGDLPDIEEMTGLFINTVPVRIRMEPEQEFAGLLRAVQQETLGSEAYGYSSLAEVQAATALKQELLDHVLVFENYPLAEELRGLEGKCRLGFQISEVRVSEPTNYDLIVNIEPGEELVVEFRYNGSVYQKEEIEEARNLWGALLHAVAGGGKMSIAELRQSVRSREEEKEEAAFVKAVMAIDEEF